MKLDDVIPDRVRDPNYNVTVEWAYLDDWLKSAQSYGKLDLDPEFQRGHVWTRDQQIAYLEYVLRGGMGSNVILWNADQWTWLREKGATVPNNVIQLVDGKQRLIAVMMFLNNELPAFGHYLAEFEDARIIKRRFRFEFRINNLQKYDDVLKWYIQLNAGGTPHTAEEIERVKGLLETVK